MANKPLKSIKFPGLTDTYTIPQIDTSLTVEGKAADAQAVGNKFTEVSATAGKAFPTDTLTGDIVTFADGADNVPMKSVVVNIEPVQSGSGDPSPDNIRPISGWTGANVVRTGKNLLDGTFVNLAIMTTDAVKLTEDATCRGMYSRVVGGNTYTFSRKLIETNRFRICATIEEPANNIGAVNISNVSANDSLYSITVTVPEGYNYLFVYLSNQAETCTADNYQLELGSTATEYEPYAGDTYSITFPSEAGTVYGGELDVTNGTLTVDRAMVTLDENGSYNINQYTDRNRIVCNMYDNVGKANAMFVSDSLKSIPPSSGGTGQDIWQIWCSNVAPRMWISVPSTIATVADFKNYLSTNPITVVYELATPITYLLTPTEIKSLLGDNNVWADAGDTSVTYRADTAKYIDKKIAEVINALS